MRNIKFLSLFRKYPEYSYNYMILINALSLDKSTILKCPPCHANSTD